MLPTPAFPSLAADLVDRYRATDAPPQSATDSASIWRLRRLWLSVKDYPNEKAIGVPFCVDGRSLYHGDAANPGYNWLCWLLRDHEAPGLDGYVAIDVVTIQALWEVQQTYFQLGISAPITITDGYRTLQTNRRREKAVSNSQHLYAKAVDCYVDGIDAADLFRICYSRRISCGDVDHRTPGTAPGDTCGGVGYYRDGHTHLDSGSRRFWLR